MTRFAFLILFALVALPHPVSGQTTTSYAIQADTFNDVQKAAKKTELLKKKGPVLVANAVTEHNALLGRKFIHVRDDLNAVVPP